MTSRFGSPWHTMHNVSLLCSVDRNQSRITNQLSCTDSIRNKYLCQRNYPLNLYPLENWRLRYICFSWRRKETRWSILDHVCEAKWENEVMTLLSFTSVTVPSSGHVGRLKFVDNRRASDPEFDTALPEIRVINVYSFRGDEFWKWNTRVQSDGSLFWSLNDHPSISILLFFSHLQDSYCCARLLQLRHQIQRRMLLSVDEHDAAFFILMSITEFCLIRRPS